jgi:hypothetical protein
MKIENPPRLCVGYGSASVAMQKQQGVAKSRHWPLWGAQNPGSRTDRKVGNGRNFPKNSKIVNPFGLCVGYGQVNINREKKGGSFLKGTLHVQSAGYQLSYVFP